MHEMRHDTGHLFFRKIADRPGFYEAMRATFEFTASGERINYEDESLGEVYRVLREDEDALCSQVKVTILDPDDFHFRTLVQVEQAGIAQQ